MTSLADPAPTEDRFRRGEITQAELDRLVPYSKLASPAAKQGHNQRMSDMRNRQFERMGRSYGNDVYQAPSDMSPAAQAARAEKNRFRQEEARRRVMSSTFNRTNMFGGGFGNPYMQRPMFGGGFGGGFNPYQQRSMFGGGFGGGFNPYQQQRPMFNPYQQQSMGFGFPRPQPRFNPYGGGFSQGFNPFRQNLAPVRSAPPSLHPSGLFNQQRLGMLGQNFRQQNPGFQNPMSDAARRQSLMAAMNARAQQQQGQAQQAQQVPTRGEEMVNTAGPDPRMIVNTAGNSGAADAARAMNQARFMAPQGLGGTAQFQNQAANQMQTGINAGAADAARAAATAQFSGIPQGLGGTAQFQNQAANQMQTGINAGAADAARAMATAQFSGNPLRQQGMDNLASTISQNMINYGGTTAPAPATTPTTVPFSGQYMTQAPLGGTYAFNPGAGGGIVPQFGLNPMNQQGAGGTNQPAAGGTV